jgi:hypothetical protein
MKKIILIMTIASMLVGCNANKQLARHEAKCYKWGVCKPISDSTATDNSDSTIFGDSTGYAADTLPSKEFLLTMILRCDSDFNVVYGENMQLKAKGIDIDTLYISNDTLKVKVTVPEKVYLIPTHYKFLQHYSRNNTTSNNTVQVAVPRELKWWERYAMFTGWIVWILIIITIIIYVRRLVKKFII